MKYIIIAFVFFISITVHAVQFYIKERGEARISVRVEDAGELANIRSITNATRIKFKDLDTNKIYNLDRNLTSIIELP